MDSKQNIINAFLEMQNNSKTIIGSAKSMVMSDQNLTPEQKSKLDADIENASSEINDKMEQFRKKVSGL